MLSAKAVTLFGRPEMRDAMFAAAVAVPGWWNYALRDLLVQLDWLLMTYLFLVGLAFARAYHRESEEAGVRSANLQTRLVEAQFQALQRQLHPHFLFNTLNTIAVRARDGDGAGTARMVEQLSDVLRRTLTRHRSSEVTLDEELELVRQYVAIEEARFPDRLSVTIDVDSGLLHAALPGFALQHLVENAIRHGIARRPGAGTVQVTASRVAGTLELRVTDDGAGLADDLVIPPNHGIENTRERLTVLYADRASLTIAGRPDGGTLATMRIPFHEIALEADVAQR
jgi:LytS/YehU family sensor histidine kinase